MICLAGLVIVVMLLIPPWMRHVRVPGKIDSTFAFGYHAVWHPPEHSLYTTEVIDYTRLGLQVGAVVTVTGLILIILPKAK
jgi:hypothetical protein